MSQVSTASVWAAPRLSMRWWPVFLRNLLVWRKLAIPSLVGNIAEPLMWLVAFGYGLGALVGQVQLAQHELPAQQADGAHRGGHHGLRAQAGDQPVLASTRWQQALGQAQCAGRQTRQQLVR